MATLNIAFEVPQTPSFRVNEFRRQMNEYAKTLIDKFNSQKEKDDMPKGHKVFSYRELSPEIQALVGICKGAVAEEDLDGDIARMEAMESEYGGK